MVINPAIWLAGWEHFFPYFRNKVFPKYVICGGTEKNINKIIFIEQIQKKLMTKFFIKLKKKQFWLIFSILGQKIFLNKIHHNFIQVSSNMPKFRKNLMEGPFYILYFIESFQLPLNPISLKLTLLWSSTRKCYSTRKLTQ